MCDDPVCIDVPFQERGDAWTSTVRTSLSEIGIGLAAGPTHYNFDGPRDMTTLEFGEGEVWQSDFPNGSSFFVPLFYGKRIVPNPSFRTVNFNVSLTGATREELKGWGYSVLSVPSLDPHIDRCLPQTGQAQAQCWAETDAYLMHDIVPAVPVVYDQVVRILSARIRNYSIDQFTALPALDQIVVASDAG